MRRILLLLTITLFFFGCNMAERKQSNSSTYFNLKLYFENEASRLTKRNPIITKTVVINNSEESKKLRIADWGKELAIFSDVDMNRAAWKGLFNVSKTDDQESYKSDNEKVPVKEVLIRRKNGKIQGIHILIKTSNILYNSADTLSYYPDSLYQINKKQHIKLLAEKNYNISGKFL